MLPRSYEHLELGQHVSSFENTYSWDEAPEQIKMQFFNSGFGDRERLFMNDNIMIGFLDSQLYKISVMIFDVSYGAMKQKLTWEHGKSEGWLKSTTWEDDHTTLELYRKPRTNMIITDKELLKKGYFA